MRAFTRAVFSVIALIWIASSVAGQRLPMAVPEQVGMSAAKLAELGPFVKNRYVDNRLMAGAVTIVARRGKIVYFEAVGEMDREKKKPMTKDAIFRFYSMTKPVVSVAVMMLADEGKIDIDAAISTYLPELKDIKVGDRREKMHREFTTRDLLRHTAGMPNNVTVDRVERAAGFPPLSESTLEEMIKRLHVVPLRYQPGAGWYYSFGADVLARLVEVISGKTIDAFLRERLFEPLDMRDTDFYVPADRRDRFVQCYGRPPRSPVVVAPHPGTTGPFHFDKRPKFLSGGGGLCSTATDYMRFCLMLMNKGEFEGHRYLKEETVEAMLSNQLPEQLLPIIRRPEGRGFGLGFAVRTKKIDSEHSSVGTCEWLGGAGTEFWLSPRDQLAVVTLYQNMPMSDYGRKMRTFVYDALEEERYLLLDSRIVEEVDNGKLTVGTIEKDDKNNPLMVADKPWELRWDNVYANVIFDAEEQLYKCWYTPFIIDERTSLTPENERNPAAHDYMRKRPSQREEALLYAISKDGIAWEKPELRIVEFNGSKKNNILSRGFSGTGVIKDVRDPDPKRRYKAFYAGQHNNIQRVRFSPDGLNWGQEIECPEIEAGGDTHNSMVWSSELQKYVGIVRLHDGRQRISGRTESANFVKWTRSVPVVTISPSAQAHDMVIFRTAGVYLGLLGVMHYPDVNSHHGVTQDAELCWSPDSRTWHRVQPGAPLIPRSRAGKKQYGKMPYDWGGIFPGVPVICKGEIQLYYGASDWYFMDWRKSCLARATLRPDGWAGYEQADANRPATVTTMPLPTGDKLKLSADIDQGGSLKVYVLDRHGNLLAVSEPMTKTITDAGPRWPKGFSIDAVRQNVIRLKFELDGAKLYSFVL